MKFKVGDIVSYSNGDVCTILMLNDSDQLYKYVLSPYNHTRNSWFDESGSYLEGVYIYQMLGSDNDLEHHRVRYNRLAKKLYPNGYKEGEWWILK